MPAVQWLHLFRAATTLAETVVRLRAPANRAPDRGRAPSDRPVETGFEPIVASVEPPLGVNPLMGQIEARLTGIVVAALKEAFDRDRTRLDLEREQIETERRRVEEALRLEALRQVGERALAELRLSAMVTIVVWLVSAVLIVLVPGMREGAAKILLASGWTALVLALVLTFVTYGRLTRFLAAASGGPSDHSALAGAVTSERWLPWLLGAGFALSVLSVIVGM